MRVGVGDGKDTDLCVERFLVIYLTECLVEMDYFVDATCTVIPERLSY